MHPSGGRIHEDSITTMHIYGWGSSSSKRLRLQERGYQQSYKANVRTWLHDALLASSSCYVIIHNHANNIIHYSNH